MTRRGGIGPLTLAFLTSPGSLREHMRWRTRLHRRCAWVIANHAVPIYRDKFVRGQVIEAMRLTDIAKGPIAAAWATTKT